MSALAASAASEGTQASLDALASGHYENFPVASWLLPRALREPVRVIYAFARTADDIADEGDATPAERAGLLLRMARELCAIDARRPNRATAPPASWLWPHMQRLIHQHRVPLAYPLDLLSAFIQDTHQGHYADMAALHDYARRSANPIGRMILHLAGYHRQPWLQASDQVCTALQLLNFCQDVADDIRQRGRLYLPLSVLRESGLALAPEELGSLRAPGFDLARLNRALEQMARLSDEAIASARPCWRRLPARLRCELTLVSLSGQRVAAKLRARTDPAQSARLNRRDRIGLLLRALLLR